MSELPTIIKLRYRMGKIFKSSLIIEKCEIDKLYFDNFQCEIIKYNVHG
jgi:hypothetical protein